MDKKLILIIVVLTFTISMVWAQSSEQLTESSHNSALTTDSGKKKTVQKQINRDDGQSSVDYRWYVGVEGGVPFAIATLSSFANEKTYIGYQAGIMGGYIFSPALSLEVNVSIGELKLGASKCCEDYWLGSDEMCYLSHVTGMDTYSFREIHSSVSMQQYALRLNVDLLQIANADWGKRWSLTVSPAVYGISTTATIKLNNVNKSIITQKGQFQFGAGIGIGAGYMVTRNLGVGLRSGMVWVFRSQIDGIKPLDHTESMIWNNTVTFTWRFGYNR